MKYLAIGSVGKFSHGEEVEGLTPSRIKELLAINKLEEVENAKKAIKTDKKG